MILGFLGKGGSGKSTLATLMTKYLLEKDNSVLAIDADHNMDFSFNLGASENIPYFGSSMSNIKEYVGNDPDIKRHYREIFLLGPKRRFSIFPNDDFTKDYVLKINENFQLMVAGPHVEEIWEGDKCSHSLFTMLKIYLPYLDLQNNQFVIIDEKAGMDPVGTLVPAGFDVAVVVSEPTLHGTKTANQICMGLEKYGTPYITVGNKITNVEQKEFLQTSLYKKPICNFSFDIKNTEAMNNHLTDGEKENLGKILLEAKRIMSEGKSREKRVTNFWSNNR